MTKYCNKCQAFHPISNFRSLGNGVLDTYCIPHRNEYMKFYNKARRQRDPQYKLLYNLRINLRSALKQNAKSGKTLDYLGCSLDEFKQYIETKFQPGMTWENYGKQGWEIDHIIPISKFDLTNESELKIACHYTNLQPLWGQDNRKKGQK